MGENEIGDFRLVSAMPDCNGILRRWNVQAEKKTGRASYFAFILCSLDKDRVEL
jgi:hypothetical protein